MNRKIANIAAAALALSFVAGVALPAIADDSDTITTQEKPVYFDLGIDVTKLPQTPVDARKYFSALDADTQRILLASCENYMKHPEDAAMPETLEFCSAIAG